MDKRKQKKEGKRWQIKLTNGEAVGPSRIANSSSVNGSRGIKKIRRGISSKIITGNPIAATYQKRQLNRFLISAERRTDSLRHGKRGAKAGKFDRSEH
jgi:hypothetical protein